MLSTTQRALVASTGILLAACSTQPPPAPGPVAVEHADVPAAAPAAPAVELETIDAPPPLAPWLPAAVRWDPSSPREGSALGLRVTPPPAGRQPVAVDGELGGEPVHFGRIGDEWFGLAPLPPGRAGSMPLELRFRDRFDSTYVQRASVDVAPRHYTEDRLRVAPRYAKPPKSELAKIAEDRKIVGDVLSTVTPHWLLSGSFAWPHRGRITSHFGERRVFNGELKSRHWGTDISGNPGQPVRAADRGRVALIRHLYYAGNAVYLDHGMGVFTAYFHLSKTLVHEGQVVDKGEEIGEVGATGRVTGPHLHWSLYIDGIHLDATSLLDIPVPSPGDSTSSTGSAKGTE